MYESCQGFLSLSALFLSSSNPNQSSCGSVDFNGAKIPPEPSGRFKDFNLKINRHFWTLDKNLHSSCGIRKQLTKTYDEKIPNSERPQASPCC